jgi:hypothetical protein
MLAENGCLPAAQRSNQDSGLHVVDERPRGLFTVDWSNPHAPTTFWLFTIFILVGYFVIWFYWRGRNWARILALLTSLLCLYNLRYFLRGGIIDRVMIGSEAALAVFLLFWLNSPKVKAFFRAPRNTQISPSPD